MKFLVSKISPIFFPHNITILFNKHAQTDVGTTIADIMQLV